MSTPGFVLLCALELLGRTNELPPLVLVDHRPPEASPHAVAFVKPGERIIYLLASSPTFQMAIDAQDKSNECRGIDELRLIASMIVHEEWHLNHGIDEDDAYLAQLTTLLRLGAGPGRWPYEVVRRSRIAVLEAAAKRRATPREIALLR